MEPGARLTCTWQKENQLVNLSKAKRGRVPGANFEIPCEINRRTELTSGLTSTQNTQAVILKSAVPIVCIADLDISKTT